MGEAFLQRVKSSLNKQYYTMNHSWLSECVDFYTGEHENYTEDEVISFVINQWILHDLREINNENGCLPTNLAKQKCTTLPGKYILQVDKLYDISTSKYKQLEKIRNVSSENIEATENENKTQEDKFQTWEPKSKRMLQLFMTDGNQEILGIEYKAIKFLNEIKEPGFKLMIKGPVICRKGVLLLEEKNIEDKGGEVDSLLITNTLENVLARALNLEKNFNPDKNKPKQNTESTQKTAQVDDNFEIDSQVLDQIDKQIQQKNTSVSKNSLSSNLSNKQSHGSISELNYSYQAPSISNQTQKSYTSSIRTPLMNAESTSNNQNNKAQKKDNNEKMNVDFDDEGDSFLEMVDDSAFITPSVSKASIVQSKVATIKQTLSSKSKEDEFPMDDEIYDLADHSPFFFPPKQISQSTTTKISSQAKDLSSITSSSKHNFNQKTTNAYKDISSSKTNLKENSSIASSYKSTSKVISQNKNTCVATPSVSDIDNLDDLNDVHFDSFDNDYDTKATNNLRNSKSTEAFTNSSLKKPAFLQESPMKHSTNSTASSDETFYENEFNEDVYKKMKEKFMNQQKSSQDVTKSLPTPNIEKSAARSTSSQVNKPSSAKLSDRLKFDSKSKDYYNINNKEEEKNYKSSQTSMGSLIKSENADRTTEHSAFHVNKSPSTKIKVGDQHLHENLDADFENDFEIEFEAKMEEDEPVIQQIQKKTLTSDSDKKTEYSVTKSQEPVNNNSDAKSSSSKRPASLMSPNIANRQKLRCLESTPKDKTSSRKITDFFDKPKPKLLNDYFPLYEAICDVLENSHKTDRIRSVVRGKVINIVKLNLLKNEGGSYFHLEGTITDGTANLDVVFCSEVLEEIVGYSVGEFILKRKLAKANPKIKDELRDNLKKAQTILRVLDALIEIEVKKNEKTLIIGCKPLTKEEKNRADERLQQYKAEKNKHK